LKLLANKSAEFELPAKPYIDLNWPPVPKHPRSVQTDLPGLCRLLDDARDGQFRTAVIDIQEEFETNVEFAWVTEILSGAGLNVVNAFYDSEGAFDEYLKNKYGPNAHFHQIGDSTDLVAFFPALAARVAEDSLRGLPGYQRGFYGTPYRELEWILHDLSQRNPYSLGRQPFVQPELEQEWREQNRAEEARSARLESERSFRIAPAGDPILLEEELKGDKPTRDAKGLKWAEERLKMELGFQSIVDGSMIAFRREYDGSLVFADVRPKGQIIFYVYLLPDQVGAKYPSSISFDVSDRVTRNLEVRWKEGYSIAVSINRRSKARKPTS
jgi:hypothetical protein